MRRWPPPPESVVRLIIEGFLAFVLLVCMTWIVLRGPSDEATKAALVIVGTAIGFIFGRQSAPPPST